MGVPSLNDLAVDGTLNTTNQPTIPIYHANRTGTKGQNGFNLLGYDQLIGQFYPIAELHDYLIKAYSGRTHQRQSDGDSIYKYMHKNT